MKMQIRRYKTGDEHEIAQLFYDTVHRVNCRDYTQQQLDKWAPPKRDIEQWLERLLETNPFVAECEGVVVGFAELEPNGHIGRFYCHHEWQRRGVGTLLYQAIEREAVKLDLSRVYAEVSITAKPFFCSRGFEVVRQQEAVLDGVPLTNYLMEKRLNSSCQAAAGGVQD